MGNQTEICCFTGKDQMGNDKKLQRKVIPIEVLQTFNLPILFPIYKDLPSPQNTSIYGDRQYQEAPTKLFDFKIPQNPKIRTKFVWTKFPIWRFPQQILKNLSPKQIKQRTFHQKVIWLRIKLKDDQESKSKGYNKMKVDSKNVLLSSYSQFEKINFNMQTKIIFDDDQKAIDAGGLFREWMNMCLIEAFSAELGMFRLCETDQTSYKICSNKNNEQVFVQVGKILGFIIGKSIIEKTPLNCPFNRTIWRQLANQPIHFNDVYDFDKGFYNSWKSLLDEKISEQDLFCFNQAICDPFLSKIKSQSYDLIENGKDVFVNQDNKQLYIQKLIQLYCTKTIKKILVQLKCSLYQVIPYQYLEVFQPEELQMLVCAKTVIDIHDWRVNTSYKGFQPTENTIIWFWEIVSKFDQRQLRNLLHYCTGSAKVPLSGFKHLECRRGKQKLFSIKKVQYNKHNPFPKGITCFNRLELPPYQTRQQLQALMLSICQEQIHDFGLDGIQH